MIIYIILQALVGLVAGLIIAFRRKKAEGITYGKLDKAGIVTNILLIPAYCYVAPFALFIGMISANPAYDGFLGLLGWLVSIIICSVVMVCGLGLGFSVSLRRKGKSKLSFAVQFAGLAALLVGYLLFTVFYGNLISTLN
jgi:hypothetical protein